MGFVFSFPFFLIVLISSAYVIYAPSLPGEFYFDDGFFLESGLFTNWSRWPQLFSGGQTISPMRGVSMMTLAVQYQIFGWSPGAFRAVNILLHGLNGCLVWLIAQSLLNRMESIRREEAEDADERVQDGKGYLDPAVVAGIAAMLFIAHPVLTSGVAYIFQRNGLLSTFFFLSAFYALLRAFPVGRLFEQRWMILCAAAYLLSTWSKEIGVTFIALAILFQWFLQPIFHKSLRWSVYLPVIAVCIFSLVMAYWQMFYTPISKRTIYGSWTVWQNIITQWNVLIEYMKMVVWPHPGWLSVDHDFPIALGIKDNMAWLSGLVLAVLLRVALVCRKRRPLMAFSAFWFFITLVPESTILPISEVKVEYRLYLPAFGFIFLGVLCLKEVALALRRPKVFYIVGWFVFLVYSVVSWQRNHVLSEGFLVWQDAALKSPMNIRANTAYAAYLKNRGRQEEALAVYKKVATLQDRKLPFKLPTPIPHNELGVHLMDSGNIIAAKKQFIKSLKIDPWHPSSRENLNALLGQTGEKNFEQAYRDIFKELPFFPRGHYNLGNFYMRSKRYEKAVTEYEMAILQNPKLFEAYNNLGTVYALMGDNGKAELLLEKALEIEPEFKAARKNLEGLQADRN